MRSIRLSLVVYFLGLLAAALGVASLLAYRTAERTLAEKRKATEQLIQAQYEERSRKERQALDEKLLQQAHTLARLVELQNDLRQFVRLHELRWLGLMSSQVAGLNAFAP